MRDSTMAIGRVIALVLATVTIISFKPALSDMKQAINADLTKHTIPAVKAEQAPANELKVPDAQTVAAQTPIEPAPSRPTPWAAVTSPNGGTDWVNKALAHLQGMGLSKQGAAMLIGNFLQEKPSAFATGDPCGGLLGDGGAAHGLGQWHPGRRPDMPCGFMEQITWAIDVEMPRDSARGGGHDLNNLLRDPNASLAQLDYGLYRWERYGHKGLRYDYGVAILNQL